MTLGTILRVKPGQRTLLAFDELQKDVKEIRGNTIVCKNSSLICTEVYTFGKSVCTEYEDCPTWPCQLTPDCSVSYQLDVDCLEWDCKDSKQEGTMNYYWLGFVAFVVILSIFTLLVLIKVYRKRNQSSREVLSSEPRVRATQEESRPFLAWLKKTKSFFSRDPQDETTAGQYPLEEGFFQGGESYGSFDAVPQTNVFGKYDTRSLPEETEFFNIDA